jgi:Asp-tRNA(Asn)/Glu-tRNA(Gln) amidotransferase B subunit
MRSKEDAQDYRYFPDPDLPPLAIDDAWIARVEKRDAGASGRDAERASCATTRCPRKTRSR